MENLASLAGVFVIRCHTCGATLAVPTVVTLRSGRVDGMQTMDTISECDPQYMFDHALWNHGAFV